MKRTILICILMLVGLWTSPSSASERLEFWDEAPRLFNTAAAGGDVSGNKELRGSVEYVSGGKVKYFSRDYADKKYGDFSVVFEAPGSDDAQLAGFTPGPWQATWPISDGFSLHLYLKAKNAQANHPWALTLVDKKGRKATMPLVDFQADGKWRQLNLQLQKFTASNDFNFEAAVACQLDTNLAKGLKVWFDDIYFTDPATGEVVGVTEKPIEQRMAEAKASLPLRKEQAIAAGAKTEWPNRWFHLRSKMALGKDIDTVNAELVQLLNDPEKKDRLFGTGLEQGNELACRLYLDYGPQGRLAPLGWDGTG